MPIHYTQKSNIKLIRRKLAPDTTKLVVRDQLEYEDGFMGLYWSDKNTGGMLIQPTYNPLTLYSIATRNNVLSQCITVMEVNIDGTGHEIVPDDKDKPSGKEKDKEDLEDFFSKPYIDMSMVVLRRLLRVDMEITGNGYMEVLLNPNNEIVFLRWMDATKIRLVKLDEPIQVEREVVRGKQTVKATIWVRERRYAEMVGNKIIYYKEFGSERDLDRETGKWAEGKNKLSADKRASTIIHFIVEREAKSPYGVPRWINQLPSILGSRKSEEFNLGFFDAGGLPPAIIFVEGGAMAPDVSDQLRVYLEGGANSKNRAAIVEVQSSSGSIDSTAGKVSVKVERFGGERTKDAMFQTYDEKCEERIRMAFRIPPIFLGKAADYNFATAFTSVMVTEKQVFGPERIEFDEIINQKIVNRMGIQDWYFQSLPMHLVNSDLQIAALPLVKGLVDGEEFVSTVADITGLDLTYSQEAVDAAAETALAIAGGQAQANQAGGKQPFGKDPNAKKPGDPKAGLPTPPSGKAKKGDRAIELIELANAWAVAMGFEPGNDQDRELITQIKKQVDELDDSEREVFNHVLATQVYKRVAVDHEGLAELAGAVFGIAQV